MELIIELFFIFYILIYPWPERIDDQLLKIFNFFNIIFACFKQSYNFRWKMILHMNYVRLRIRTISRRIVYVIFQFCQKTQQYCSFVLVQSCNSIYCVSDGFDFFMNGFTNFRVYSILPGFLRILAVLSMPNT